MIESLSKRERQIVEVLLRKGHATAAEIRAEMKAAPSYSAVRTMLTRLEAKGAISHKEVGQTYVYHSVNAPAQIRTSALRELINAFFNGSAVNAASTLIGLSRKLSPDEAAELQRAIDRARVKR